jgi:hypothetical protein
LRVQKAITGALLNQLVQALLSNYQRQRPQILAIQPKQIECIENGMTSPGHEMIELADSMRIEANDFAIQDCVLGQSVQRFPETFERLEVVQIAADEFAIAIFDIRNRTEAVMFEFEDVVRRSQSAWRLTAASD